MKGKAKAFIVAAIIVVLVAAGLFALNLAVSQRRDAITYVTRPVGYADISATVAETGIVNPVNQVAVGSEVSGTIRSLGADYNSKVTKGQMLATLDPTTYQAAVDSAQANLTLVQASLESARVNVGKTKALLDLANLTLQRDDVLAKQGFINGTQLDADRTAAATSQQDYLSSQAAVRVAEAQVSVVRGQVEQARFNLSKTVILSPFDGIVLARNVSIGQTVAASLQTPTLFSIATNLTDMQVDTSVGEADVGNVRAGQSALITVTAYPNVVFSGTVKELRINPTVTQNVVTYDAVVQVQDTSGRLFPGMSAQVTIEVGKRQHVLVVPTAAVLFRPLPTQQPGGGGLFASFGAGINQASTPVAGAPGSQVTVWVLRDGRPTPVQVVIGLTDGKNIEITSGGLQPGDEIITSQRRGPARGGSRAQGGAPAANGAGGSRAASGAAAGAGAAAGVGAGTGGGASASPGAGTGGSAAATPAASQAASPAATPAASPAADGTATPPAMRPGRQAGGGAATGAPAAGRRVPRAAGSAAEAPAPVAAPVEGTAQ